jgi:hypothetical protein
VKFETEAALCDAFMFWARAQGWVCYPETDGWDLILVDRHGFQIGIEAKLRLNLKVIQQALPIYGGASVGPDHRALLVPDYDGSLERLLESLGLYVFHAGSSDRYPFRHHEPELRGEAWTRRGETNMFDWNPVRRCTLPEYVPDVRAGVSAPLQLTPWKIGALKVLAHLERHSTITRAQIKAFHIDPRGWTDGKRWLVPFDGDPKRGGRYIKGKNCPRFDQQHPTVYAQVLADLPAPLNSDVLDQLL